MYNLTQQELYLVKRYTFLKKLIMPSLLGAFLQPLLWLILTIADDFYLDAEGFFGTGLTVTLVLTGILLAVFAFSAIASAACTRSADWESASRKLEYLSNGMCPNSNYIGGMTAVPPYAAEELHNQLRGSLSSAAAVKAALWIIPPFLLIACFVPELIQSSRQKESRIERITMTEETVCSIFENIGYACSSDDPESFGTDSCRIYCRPESGSADDRYASFQMDREGVIERCTFNLDTDAEISTFENIDELNHFISECMQTLSGSQALIHLSLLECTEVPPELVDACFSDEDYYASMEENGLYYSLMYQEHSDGSHNLYFTVELDNDY